VVDGLLDQNRRAYTAIGLTILIPLIILNYVIDKVGSERFLNGVEFIWKALIVLVCFFILAGIVGLLLIGIRAL
jgi:hypothetical protein